MRLPLAGFQVITYGRFWVFTEGPRMVVFHDSFSGRSSAWRKSPRWNTCNCDWRWSRRDHRQIMMRRAEGYCGSSQTPIEGRGCSALKVSRLRVNSASRTVSAAVKSATAAVSTQGLIPSNLFIFPLALWRRVPVRRVASFSGMLALRLGNRPESLALQVWV